MKIENNIKKNKIINDKIVKIEHINRFLMYILGLSKILYYKDNKYIDDNYKSLNIEYTSEYEDNLYKYYNYIKQYDQKE